MPSRSQERHLRMITKVCPHPGQGPQVDTTSDLGHPAITSTLAILSDGLDCVVGLPSCPSKNVFKALETLFITG